MISCFGVYVRHLQMSLGARERCGLRRHTNGSNRGSHVQDFGGDVINGRALLSPAGHD
jgi:hypothetical protein